MSIAAQAETPTRGGGCTLPYPDRFHAAVQYITKLPAGQRPPSHPFASPSHAAQLARGWGPLAEGLAIDRSGVSRPHEASIPAAGDVAGAKPIKDETRLLLYALGQQATEGPCKDTKPWGWNVVETAKWQTWSQLGTMSKVEAMRLYVRELEDEQPDWFALLGDYTPPPPDSSAAAPEVQEPQSSSGLSAVKDRDTWVKLDVAGAKKPPPRCGTPAPSSSYASSCCASPSLHKQHPQPRKDSLAPSSPPSSSSSSSSPSSSSPPLLSSLLISSSS